MTMTITNRREGHLTITLAPSQGRMAPSIEVRTALARLGVQFWKVPVNSSAYPRVFLKPIPQPVETPTCEHRYGFPGVRVQVALEYPRVTHANP